MKTYFPILLLLLLACNVPKSPKTTDMDNVAATVPAVNTVVASDSMPIPDELNELYFSVEVIATDKSANGTYEVLVSYGHNDASTQITMPEAEHPITPEIRRGEEPATYILGFHYGADTSFNDYFLIKGGRRTIEMKYLKAYSFR